MDPRERLGDREETLRMMLDSFRADLHTAFPGIIESFDAVAMTAKIQPTIKARVRDQLGALDWVSLPLLLDCPVMFPSGGGFTLTFPVNVGDEVLVVIAERCIDAWWTSGGVQTQAELRMHDLSDGFFFPKVWSQPKKLTNVSTSSAQLRSDTGNTYIDLVEGLVTIKGDLRVTGAITAGYGTGDQVGVQTHTHAQDADSHGDTEEETHAPTPGT